MLRFLLCLLVFLFIVIRVDAQYFPGEGAQLNYRLIGFSFPQAAGRICTLEIGKGFLNDEVLFQKYRIASYQCKAGRVLAEVPLFGAEYTWRIVGIGNNMPVAAGVFHHFSTGSTIEVDTNLFRLRIIEKASKFKDAYVFLDGSKALYNMRGQAVWYLPLIPGIINEKSIVRDLKLTTRGTITFLLSNSVYEITYDGKVLWQGPDNNKIGADPSDHYHHEFTRLKNGHYMVLGNETGHALWTAAAKGADSRIITVPDEIARFDTANEYRPVDFGTVEEYDAAGRLVWHWSSTNYFRNSDLSYHRQPDGMPCNKLHENGFYFDEPSGVIYLSFKEISRVVKVKYPEGTVLNSYGEIFKHGFPGSGAGLFCQQHCCRKTRDGSLLLYNNNMCKFLTDRAMPTIIKMREPATKTASLQKAWEYVCATDDNPGPAMGFPVGGSVQELPDNSIFACMGGGYSKVFIVTPAKKILWSALPEKYDVETRRWMPEGQYRAHMITDRAKVEEAAFLRVNK